MLSKTRLGEEGAPHSVMGGGNFVRTRGWMEGGGKEGSLDLH